MEQKDFSCFQLPSSSHRSIKGLEHIISLEGQPIYSLNITMNTKWFQPSSRNTFVQPVFVLVSLYAWMYVCMNSLYAWMQSLIGTGYTSIIRKDIPAQALHFHTRKTHRVLQFLEEIHWHPGHLQWHQPCLLIVDCLIRKRKKTYLMEYTVGST